MKTNIAMALLVLAFISMAGCKDADSPGKAIVLLAGDNGLAARSLEIAEKSNEVALEDIQNLTVVVTRIVLEYDGNGGASEGEGEGEGEGETSGSEIVIFSGEKTVDIRDLTGISELIASMEIPAGHYSKIRLSVQDPTLTLASAPDTPITDIQLTANARLFVSTGFDIPAGQSSLILLDFQGIHLVETGGGKYVWTPQLRAGITVTPANAQATGTISAVDTTAKTLTLDIDSVDSLLEVAYADATIFLSGDTDTPTGTEADLQPGTGAQIGGTMDVQGIMTADTIRLLAPANG